MRTIMWWDVRNLRQMVVVSCVLMIIACTTTAVLTVTPPTRTHRNVLQHVKYWYRLRKFAQLIQKHNLSHHFEQPDITVFVPVSASYDRFLQDARRCGYDTSDPIVIEKILLYHIAGGITGVSDMGTRRSVMTPLPGMKRLYFNSFDYGKSTVNTVNGAWIMEADIIASNGIVHLIDRFIVPVQSNKTVADYLEKPDIPNLAFQSIKNASIVDLPLKLATNLTTHRFTVFSPNDSYITVMPDYAKDILFNNTELLKTVFWAHVIEEELLYIPRLGDVPDTAAKDGMLRFQRHGSDIYVSNNRVRARIIQANLPVENGVIHVIDDLLYFIYRNIRQTVDSFDNASFMKSGLTNVDKELVVHLEDATKGITFFVPSDDAFAKLPTDQQIQLANNITSLTKCDCNTMFKDHTIMYTVKDVDSFQDGETFTTADGKMLTIRRIRKAVYVEGGGVRAKISTPDIGCTNGIIHRVNSVLFQRDFTIWDAIQGHSQLTKMKEFVTLYYTELIDTLSATMDGPMTVFLISDAAINTLPADTTQYLQMNSGLLVEAIQGSIAHGVILSSSQIDDEQDVPTLSGRTITIYNTEQGLYIIGSRIRANIVVEDIWCSNGVLHITDNIVHLPTRNIIDEIGRQQSLSVMNELMQAFPELIETMSDNSKTYTMFVPSDEAFTHMPTHRAQSLSKTPAVLKEIIRAHIIEGAQMFIEEYGNYSKLISLNGDALFVLKYKETVYANSNNVQGMVTEYDIRCTNGIIHVVDTLLQFPFWTVAEVMETRPELKPFYDMLKTIDDFYTWSDSHDVNQTILVPSATFLESLSSYHKTFISTERGMIRKIFNSHAIPASTLSQRYLDGMFKSSRLYMTENRYDITFNFYDMDPTNNTETTSIDIGYANLRYSFDMVRDGIACSNGVLYVIDGFLNYPIHNTLEAIKLQPEIGIGTDQLLKLIPSNSSIDLASKDTVFTVFAPKDDSFEFLTMNDINYINQNLSYTDRMEIVRRHIVKGQQITYDSIVDGTYDRFAQDRNITVISQTDGFYLKWRDIVTKIVQFNILTTNGIIHVVDRLMLTTPYQTTTLPPTTTTLRPVSSASSNSPITSTFISLISCILTLAVLHLNTFWYDYR